jgi:hypothetical protein
VIDTIATTIGTLVIAWAVRWYWRNDWFDLRSTWEDWRRKRAERNRYWT